VAIVNAFSSQETWCHTGGPEGGYISVLEMFDSVIIAGANRGGLYRSTDSAKTWTEGKGVGFYNIYTGLARLGSILIAATGNSRLFFSYDMGENWIN
jgi:hypothetical protein